MIIRGYELSIIGVLRMQYNDQIVVTRGGTIAELYTNLGLVTEINDKDVAVPYWFYSQYYYLNQHGHLENFINRCVADNEAFRALTVLVALSDQPLWGDMMLDFASGRLL